MWGGIIIVTMRASAAAAFYLSHGFEGPALPSNFQVLSRYCSLSLLRVRQGQNFTVSLDVHSAVFANCGGVFNIWRHGVEGSSTFLFGYGFPLHRWEVRVKDSTAMSVR